MQKSMVDSGLKTHSVELLVKLMTVPMQPVIKLQFTWQRRCAASRHAFASLSRLPSSHSTAFRPRYHSFELILPRFCDETCLVFYTHNTLARENFPDTFLNYRII